MTTQAALRTFASARPRGSLGRASRPVHRSLPPSPRIGTALVVGDVWAETVVLPDVVTGDAAQLLGNDIGGMHLALVVAYALFAIGWVLFALTMRAAVGAIEWLLVVGGVITFLPVGGSYVLLAVGGALVVARTGGGLDAEGGHGHTSGQTDR